MAKSKISSDKLKQFFANHAEKLALAVGVAICGWYIYSALKVERWPSETKGPPKLLAQADSVRATVVDQPWVPENHNIVLPKPTYEEQLRDLSQPIDAAKFALSGPWNNPLQESQVRREEPQYLPLQDLRAIAMRGAVSLKGDNGYSGQQWIALTALVPYKAQVAAYDAKFTNARHKDARLDKPRYEDFVVERRELINGELPKDPNAGWAAINKNESLVQALKEFAAGPRLVEPKFEDLIAVCQPVFPLVGQQQTDAVAHPPQIPFAPQEDRQNEAPQEKAAEPAPAENPLDGGNPLAGGGNAQRVPIQPANNAAAQAAPEIPEFKLFRFFDRSVESGRTYQYRVKLALHNPNDSVPVRFLQDPKLAEGKHRETAFSEPSAAATLPGDYIVVAREIKGPAGPNEARINITVVKWDVKQGVVLSKTYEQRARGEFVDEPSAEVTITRADGKPGKAAVDMTPKFLLVDMTGGETITAPNGRPYKAPSETLLMRPDGRMELNNDWDSADFLTQHGPKAAVAPKAGESASEEPESPKAPTSGSKPFDINSLGNPQ